jgi:hypothetical protein
VKFFKWAFLVWSVCATLIILITFAESYARPVTETHVFCAYNRLFVEFDENGKRWGTIMLDYNGKPISCHDDDDIKVENTI